MTTIAINSLFYEIVRDNTSEALKLLQHKDVKGRLNEKLVNHQDAIRQTCLHVACNRGNAIVSRKLLECGASPDIMDSFMNTPLHAMAVQGNLEMVKLLVEYQADVTYKDDKVEKTAYDKAVMYGMTEVAEYLYKIEHGSRICECENNARIVSRLRQAEDKVNTVDDSCNKMKSTTKDLEEKVAELEIQVRQLKNENYPKTGRKNKGKEDPKAAALYAVIQKNFLNLQQVVVARNHMYYLLQEGAILLADRDAIDNKQGGNQARTTELLMILLSKEPEVWVYKFIKSLERDDKTKHIAKELLK